MTFEDVPDHWASLSLADPRLCADVLDLLVSADDRAQGCITLLLCDEAGVLIEPLALTLGHQDHSGEAAHMLPRLRGVLRSVGASSLVMAVARSGYSAVTDADRLWHQAVIDLTSTAEVRLLGTYVITRSDVVRLPEPLADSA